MDFDNERKYSYYEYSWNYTLQHIRQVISKATLKIYGKVMQKLSSNYKKEGAGYYNKRKKG